jgi:hypothetical protein
LIILYLGEFEAEFKKALARESGAQGVLFDEKTEGRKSRDTIPLRLPKLNVVVNKMVLLVHQPWGLGLKS